MHVSVIIPGLNEGKYIENCLRSIKAQSYKNYDIIVVDSDSRDKTTEIARKYARVINTGRGVSLARNTGANIAKGDILVFLDADTILQPNTLSEFVKAFEKNIIGCTCPIFPSHYTVRNLLIYLSLNQFVDGTIQINKPQVPGMCCAYRRDAFEKIGGFNEEMDTFEDFDLSRRIAKLGRVKFVKSTLATTSHRRVEKWGSMKVIKNYLHAYSKFLLTGKSLGRRSYMPIR